MIPFASRFNWIKFATAQVSFARAYILEFLAPPPLSVRFLPLTEAAHLSKLLRSLASMLQLGPPLGPGPDLFKTG